MLKTSPKTRTLQQTIKPATSSEKEAQVVSVKGFFCLL
jgi:hypothetical protein